MILRSIIIAAGLAGAFSAAQFPAYSQQYMQRLGGAVDALGDVVADFDASATALGLSREQALEQMTGSAFVEARRRDMAVTFDRFDSLSDDLAVLESMGPFTRAYNANRFMDAEIAQGAWSAFQPAVPVTQAAAIFAGFGFVVVGGGVMAVFSIVRPRRRRVAMAA